MSLPEVPTIQDRGKDRVEQIAARYVTSEAIGLAMVERLRKDKAKTKAARAA